MCDLESVYRVGGCDGRCGRRYTVGDQKCLRRIPGGWAKCPGLGHPHIEKVTKT